MQDKIFIHTAIHLYDLGRQYVSPTTICGDAKIHVATSMFWSNMIDFCKVGERFCLKNITTFFFSNHSYMNSKKWTLSIFVFSMKETFRVNVVWDVYIPFVIKIIIYSFWKKNKTQTLYIKYRWNSFTLI